MVKRTSPFRRINGFAVFKHGALCDESFRRYKFACLEWAKTKRVEHSLGPRPVGTYTARRGWTWDQHAAADGLTIRRVQVLVFEEIAARHGNTGRKRPKGKADDIEP
jgi:hypothetical protein